MTTTADTTNVLAASPPPARVHDLAVLDLDGVVYVGPDAVPGAADALARARAAGMAAFVTNNASRPPRRRSSTTSSGSASRPHRTTSSPPPRSPPDARGPAAAGLAGPRRRRRGSARGAGGDGLRPVTRWTTSRCAVVQGFSPATRLAALAEGTRAVRAGLPWVASNLDMTFPTPHGPAPGNGALVGAVAAAAGGSPDDVAGKPPPSAFHEAARATAALGRSSSATGSTPTSRVPSSADPGLASSPASPAQRPAALRAGRAARPLGRDLDALHTAHPRRRRTSDGTGRCGDATVAPCDDGAVVVRPGDDALDLLRAACAAAWPASTPRLARPGPVVPPSASLEPDAAWAR